MFYDLYKYRDLILNLVSRDLKVRYRRSFLGLLWSVLQPLLYMLVLFAVFSALFRFRVENYPVYALSGVVFWNFFSQGLLGAMNSLRSRAMLLNRVPIPKQVFLVSTVLAGVLHLLFAFISVFAIVILTNHEINASVLFLPVSIFLAFVFTLGIGMILAPLAVFFSDVVELTRVILQLLYFLTPVFYPADILPPRLAPIIRLNPIRLILETFRDPIYYGKVPALSNLGAVAALAIISLTCGTFVFKKLNDRIAVYL